MNFRNLLCWILKAVYVAVYVFPKDPVISFENQLKIPLAIVDVEWMLLYIEANVSYRAWLSDKDSNRFGILANLSAKRLHPLN